MKKIFALTLLMLALFVSACGAERSQPSADINTLCRAYLHGDEAPLSKIGFTKESYKNEVVGEFAKALVSSSGIQFSDEQISKLSAAMFGIFQRSTFETETVSENGDEATVKITMGVFNKGFSEENINTKMPADVTNLSEDEIKDAFINAMVEIMNEMQIVKNEDIFIECEYNTEGKMWLPKDLSGFGMIVVKTMLDMD